MQEVQVVSAEQEAQGDWQVWHTDEVEMEKYPLGQVTRQVSRYK